MTSVALAVLVLQSQAFALSPANVDCDQEESFPIITLAELKTELASEHKPFVVDVNGAKSFKKKHVTNAILFESGKKLLKALPKDKSALIVAYCGGPQCTAWHKAGKLACKNGYTNVKHFKDGIQGWVE